MPMSHTALVANESDQTRPILVVDKNGKIGETLVKQLKEQALVVFVSGAQTESLDNVIYVPFDKKIPTIPDNKYSHIFLIDEGFKITEDVIKAFTKKAEEDNTFLVVCVNAAFVNAEFVHKFTSSFSQARIAILGEVFETNRIYDSTTEINKYILTIKTEGRIYVPGDGTLLTEPVLFSDAIFAILETVFGDKEGQIFYVFPKHRITLLSLAHIFQKINPDIKIDFIKEEKPLKEFKPFESGEYLLGESYDLEKQIGKIKFEDIVVSQPNEIKTPPPKPRKNKKLSLKIIILSLILLLLLPLLATTGASLLGAGCLFSVNKELGQGDFDSLKTTAVLALNSFNLADLSLQALSYELNLVNLDSQLTILAKDINFGQDVSEMLLSTIDSSEKIRSILQGNSKNPAADFTDATLKIKNSLYIYNRDKQLGMFPLGLTQKIDNLAQIVSSTIDFWPDMLGFNGSKKYLILFQNNMELRPGGGFIGSYAVLNLNKGRIAGFKIFDVYDADGQLKGHVEPPYPIRRYLPSINWYLRDSNFNVDFSKGAVASAVFLNSEMQQAVDGVVGVDLSFVKNLLTVTGPVEVTDYNQTVNADNFFQIAQSHAEDNFFPGSTQKKDFLSAFYNALQNKISQEKDLSYLNLAEVLVNSIKDKHVLFAFNNAGEQATFAVNDWSSSLIQDSPTDNTSVADFIGINEANLGGNKINYFIARSLLQKAEIRSDGTINESLAVAFKNSAPQSLGDKGAYKNYLRFILPQNATITGIQINGQTQKIIPAITDPTIYEKKGFVPPSGLEVQTDEQSGKTIYGFLVIIPAQALETINIQYSLAQKVSFSSGSVSYQLKVFKQPGIDFLPYGLTLTFPQNFKVISKDSDITVNNQSAVLSTQIEEDRTISINLAAK